MPTALATHAALLSGKAAWNEGDSRRPGSVEAPLDAALGTRVTAQGDAQRLWGALHGACRVRAGVTSARVVLNQPRAIEARAHLRFPRL